MKRRRIGGIAGVLLAVAPAFSQAPVPPPPASQADRGAIAASVRRQLTACWSLPAGFEGRAIEVTVAFLGSGELDGEPAVTPLAGKATDKLAPLAASAVRAVKRCAPFEGLDALGARAGERFSITVNFQS
ncbi:hypothetical protein VE25_20285 [Devosia geojensis]|uniref:TonB C-terminal domain-containing protein n=1 Tax=Devosia geojensis TaxID=443610 RepID=A0A0F5FEH4_9HYPH|nr:hypothetical protein [Devosia geojensis]KKB06990.1 hypothetical protein VE25_20285 [Devosia geojensis]